MRGVSGCLAASGQVLEVDTHPGVEFWVGNRNLRIGTLTCLSFCIGLGLLSRKGLPSPPRHPLLCLHLTHMQKLIF